MKKAVLILSLGVIFVSRLFGEDILTGDRRTACEVLLCLSSGTRPSECNPPLARFFSIKFKKPWKTLQARRNFLKLCPTDTGDTAEDLVMSDYKEILANSEDPNQCTPPYLNQQLQNGRVSYSLDNRYYKTQGYQNNDNGVRINPNMPSFCYALINHQYTDLKMPRYNCSGEFYTQKDWQNGYKLEEISKDTFNNLSQNERYLYSYDCSGEHRNRTCYYYFKKIPINKTCWSY
ncbi:cpp45 [Campylobacter hyointestinalis subsp. hyointestinalis]|uniref:Cpp45 n=1 Tax=Campylobacter hyointestinalis subsp. hyointestinalis TaxID=91352 RepID=A0A9W5AUS7_CAMHY|nr:TrbM/KikA/MpfK family conjugal transfer protein [Campylobacter hyointestinalis]CUU72433.1 cpp45 [Campylobacter hyointestinalis subsp. hyointestinalis]CUU72440.1 cpp45 [Campylobacter hyointestinalis subsp. hyointestinalis]CUU84557.1 cpp45 [Campylobacter hyointestinalis subsp. hyointestinalis]